MGGQWERVNSLSFSCEEMKILDIENYNDNIKDLSKKTLRKKSCEIANCNVLLGAIIL